MSFFSATAAARIRLGQTMLRKHSIKDAVVRRAIIQIAIIVIHHERAHVRIHVGVGRNQVLIEHRRHFGIALSPMHSLKYLGHIIPGARNNLTLRMLFTITTILRIFLKLRNISDRKFRLVLQEAWANSRILREEVGVHIPNRFRKCPILNPTESIVQSMSPLMVDNVGQM